MSKLFAMKQFFIFLFACFILSSCRFKTGSGNIVTESRSVNSFDAISVGGGFEVEVKTGPVVSVTVEADDNIIKHIETKISGNTLKISTEDLHNYSDVHMKVYITAPSVSTIKASASAEVTVQDVLKNNGKLTFKASSGSEINAEVEAPEVEADVSSGGHISLKGKTRNYKAEASSGSEIRSWDLLTENTKVTASSGSSARVHASVSLNASASSGSLMRYHGAASVNKSESSGGSVSKNE